MQTPIKNTSLCMNQDCEHMTAWVQNLGDVSNHPQHVLRVIGDLGDQSNDPKNYIIKFLETKNKIKKDIDEKYKELNDLTKPHDFVFVEKIQKLYVNEMKLFDEDGQFFLNFVRNPDSQIIGKWSKDISKFFSISLKEIEIQLKEAASVQSKVRKTVEEVKKYSRKIIKTINPDQLQTQQEFKWSEVMKHKDIIIDNNKVKNGSYGTQNPNYQGALILLEPKIDFNSIKSFTVRFSGSHRNFTIRLVDYKLLREKNPKYIGYSYGDYTICNNGNVAYDNNILRNKSFEFSLHDLIQIYWDGPRKIFRISKIGKDQIFELPVDKFENDLELYFGVSLANNKCSLE